MVEYYQKALMNTQKKYIIVCHDHDHDLDLDLDDCHEYNHNRNHHHEHVRFRSGRFKVERNLGAKG